MAEGSRTVLQPSPHGEVSSDATVALQGGGAHGAYAWGVLDRLLEDGLRPAAISGVSSGALLGVALSQGWARGGADGARAEMRRLWTAIGRTNALGPLAPWLRGWDPGGLAWQGMEAVMRLFSPSQLNPLGHHPLRAVMSELLDPDLLASPRAIPLTVFATDVRSGTATPFAGRAITTDALLASCCLPLLFPPVEINGRAYWDGGFSGNPPLQHLLAPGLPRRLVLVRAQARRHASVPTTPTEIIARMHDLAFQGVLDAELAGLPDDVDLVSYDADAALADLPLSSVFDTDPGFLDRLFQSGRETGAARRQAA